MLAKYGRFCIIIRQKIAYRGITFVPNKIFNFYRDSIILGTVFCLGFSRSFQYSNGHNYVLKIIYSILILFVPNHLIDEEDVREIWTKCRSVTKWPNASLWGSHVTLFPN
jgi:hypothetical protein